MMTAWNTAMTAISRILIRTKRHGEIKEEIMNGDTTIPVIEYKLLEEGMHMGVILDVIRRMPDEKSKYDYTDIIIEDSETKTRIKAGYPTTISFDSNGEPKSALAGLVSRCGFTPKPGENFDTKQLISTPVTFQTLNKKTAEGVFSRVIRETVKKKAL
jgi:hypothetical protein